jgi:hypothetical protein
MFKEKIIQEILFLSASNKSKISLRTISKKTFEDKLDFKKQVNNFIRSIKSKLVKLELKNVNFNVEKDKQPYQHWSFSFEVIFVLNDPYINGEIYREGSIYIFPSRKMYADIQKKCLSIFDVVPQWNTENTKATVIGEARAY